PAPLLLSPVAVASAPAVSTNSPASHLLGPDGQRLELIPTEIQQLPIAPGGTDIPQVLILVDGSECWLGTLLDSIRDNVAAIWNYKRFLGGSNEVGVQLAMLDSTRSTLVQLTCNLQPERETLESILYQHDLLASYPGLQGYLGACHKVVADALLWAQRVEEFLQSLLASGNAVVPPTYSPSAPLRSASRYASHPHPHSLQNLQHPSYLSPIAPDQAALPSQYQHRQMARHPVITKVSRLQQAREDRLNVLGQEVDQIVSRALLISAGRDEDDIQSILSTSPSSSAAALSISSSLPSPSTSTSIPSSSSSSSSAAAASSSSSSPPSSSPPSQFLPVEIPQSSAPAGYTPSQPAQVASATTESNLLAEISRQIHKMQKKLKAEEEQGGKHPRLAELLTQLENTLRILSDPEEKCRRLEARFFRLLTSASALTAGDTSTASQVKQRADQLAEHLSELRHQIETGKTEGSERAALMNRVEDLQENLVDLEHRFLRGFNLETKSLVGTAADMLVRKRVEEARAQHNEVEAEMFQL
ncbi:MAG: hypothetical protein K2Q09_02495, partial [Phycisphaerales bacterium]|nr:hypothetical protein [Phycisphaerales bacterium]